MGNISKHIDTNEIKCPCGCGFAAADVRLVRTLENVCEYFLAMDSNAVRVSAHFGSWCRCEEYDAELHMRIAEQKGITYIPKQKPRQHARGWATDCWFEFVYADINSKTGRPCRAKIDDNLIAEYFIDRFPNSCGIGRYNGRTHIDMRAKKARWDNRGK